MGHQRAAPGRPDGSAHQPRRGDGGRPGLPPRRRATPATCRRVPRRPGSHGTLVWLNGFLLGRLWTRKGPQHTLYAPGPLWRAGTNEILVLDLPGTAAGLTVELRDHPDLGPTAPARH
ncbi:hypothetical protein ACH4M4_31610 [Streptomyces sp. NPDC017254]|uniref:hypothetical protein n=1 Tax=unclassified Streptomyces TaxID=2593676 RepID=UPI00378F0A93